MNEVLTQMWNVFEENSLVTHADMIEHHEVLMELAHVTDLGNDRNACFARHETYREKFENSTRSFSPAQPGVTTSAPPPG